jgi:hypothetical protein
MWFSSWQSEFAEDFMVLYDRMADSELGEDFGTLIDMEDAYRYWAAGREKVLFGQPLRSRMVLEIQGLSQHAREEYFANLMS